jgi:hypothetical protein
MIETNLFLIELQVNYLLALIHVLRNIPSQIAINEIAKVYNYCGGLKTGLLTFFFLCLFVY